MLKRVIYSIAAGLLALSLSACGGGRADRVETPAGMNMQRGRNYKEVIEDFQDKGFTNIRTETIEDLEFGWTVKNEEVEEILVGGDKRYDAGVWVPADTEVVIRYHTYNRKASEEEAAGETDPGDKPAEQAPADKAPASGADAAKETSKENSKETSKETSKEASKETSEETSDETSKKASKETPDEASDQASQSGTSEPASGDQQSADAAATRGD